MIKIDPIMIVYDGMRYQIFSDGKLKRVATGKILTPHICKNGYLSIRFGGRNNTKQIYIHRLVAGFFIPNPNNLKYVHHIDGNKLNNNIDNLEWISIKDHNKITVKKRKK